MSLADPGGHSGERAPEAQAGPSPFAGLLAEANGVPIPRAAPPTQKILAERRALALPGSGNRPSETPRPTAPPAAEGRTIGSYRVLEEIGSGGMAVVYRALQPSLDRLVAIKELRSEFVSDTQLATRFEREASSLATLQHGNIVHVYDFLRSPTSLHIVMEYVDGVDLFDVLADGGRVPPEIAALIAAQVAAGLEYAHYRGIVHRDIKPSNVLISKRGEVKLMDFGIARDHGKSELTEVGLALGTPAYMAPEQLCGDRIDFRADIFALGLVLYEMLAGRKPWAEEEHRALAAKVLDEPHVPLQTVVPDAPMELVRLVDRCLAKTPAARYASTFEVRRELERFVEKRERNDPRARLVLYLRNRGILSEAETSRFVPQELLADEGVRRRDAGIPLPPAELLVRPVAIASAMAAAMFVVVTLLTSLNPLGKTLEPRAPKVLLAEQVEAQVKLRLAELSADAAFESAPSRPKTELRGDEGFVQVMVQPWARVWVDGIFHDFTPFEAPIALSPGPHRIRLQHPRCEPVERTVQVKSGSTQVLAVTLAPRGQEATP